ncbi:hypothetical protein [Sulfurospirillum sp. hDNRA2]|uniref:hypothetical protein n=1 Tax=Sulfurospirillum sp. hDNRA2 TaxID=3237298 RepID=UPI0020B7848B|nr:hypothetical protein [Sulfurospirillum sp. DNRA8]MCP3653135.1 hypothetical protein [Sulfurospirillum sp. DNRA8]MCR1811986.1 hypothetical protein [Sulfurospirillum sp. DNRA8]
MSSTKNIVNYLPTEQELIQVKTACDDLKKYLITYKINSSMSIFKNIYPNETKIKYTINEFFNSRKEINKVKQRIINQLAHDFSFIQNHDFIYTIDQTKTCAYHTMRLLCFIYDALHAYSLSINKQYLARTVAKERTTKANLIKSWRHHKNQLDDPSIIIKTEHSIKYDVYDMLIHNPKLIKYYLGVFSLIPLHQIKIFYEEDDATQLLIQFLSFFSSATLTKKQIALSLAIALNFYMRLIMHMKPKNIEIFIQYIINTCFSNGKEDLKIGYKSSELLQNIHLSDTIGFIPIFSIATKQEQYYNDREIRTLCTLHNKAKRECNIVLDLPVEYQKDLITNPLYLYSARFPSEMLEEIL